MFKYISFAALIGAVCIGQAAAAAVEPASERNPLCKFRNGYLPIEGNCDAYIECKEYAASEMMCPDGLHYNPSAAWPEYPCGYPMDVPCLGRGAPQPAQATSECPHLYGFFQSPFAKAGNCGQYRMCVEGNAIEMMCPPGLAFNPESARCDWPDLVPSCKVEDFLGFKCPPAPIGQDGEPLLVHNHKYEGNCYAFFSCENGHPRLLTCDAGFAFDAASGHCVDADKVSCAAPGARV